MSVVDHCANSKKGIETLPICCLIIDDEIQIWCKRIIVVDSHVGFRHGVKFCSNPLSECPHMSTAELHFQEKDREKYVRKRNKG